MRWWFGRKAAAPDERPFVPAWLQASEPAGFARSYDSQFEEVYRRNPVGQRAVRLVAGMLGALPRRPSAGDRPNCVAHRNCGARPSGSRDWPARRAHDSCRCVSALGRLAGSAD